MENNNNDVDIQQTAEEQINAEVPETQFEGNVEAPKEPNTMGSRILKEIREWLIALAVALLVAFVIRTFVFTMIRVDGASMNDTLQDGERLVTTIADVKISGVERGNVVICYYPERGRTYFVKRVVAVPGDQVERRNGVTYVIYTDEDGQTVEEALDENRYYPSANPSDYEAYTLDSDEYFVVGDNRYDSHDSRDWNDSNPSGDVGPITKDMIVGRARYVVWPLSDIREIK